MLQQDTTETVWGQYVVEVACCLQGRQMVHAIAEVKTQTGWGMKMRIEKLSNTWKPSHIFWLSNSHVLGCIRVYELFIRPLALKCVDECDVTHCTCPSRL